MRKLIAAFLASVALVAGAPTAVETVKGYQAEIVLDTYKIRDSVFTVHAGSGYGTGWALDETTIVTNWHVIAKEHGIHPLIFVQTRDNKITPAEVVTFSESWDLAVLRIRPGIIDNPLRIAHKPPVRGDRLFTVGYPQYKAEVPAQGTLGMLLPLDYGDDPWRNGPSWKLIAYVTDIPSGPGASGSPVLNAHGEVMGILFAGNKDLGFTLLVPVEYLTELVRRTSTETTSGRDKD